MKTTAEAALRKLIALVKGGDAATLSAAKSYADGVGPWTDVTEAYAAWTPPSGKTKSKAAFIFTLEDGSYRIRDGELMANWYTVCTGESFRYLTDRTGLDDGTYDVTAYVEYGQGPVKMAYLDVSAFGGSLEIGGDIYLHSGHIPLPTAADAGRVLVAAGANRAVWAAPALTVTTPTVYGQKTPYNGTLSWAEICSRITKGMPVSVRYDGQYGGGELRLGWWSKLNGAITSVIFVNEDSQWWDDMVTWERITCYPDGFMYERYDR